MSAQSSPPIDEALQQAKETTRTNPLAGLGQLRALERQCKMQGDGEGLQRVRLTLSNWYTEHGSLDSARLILVRLELETRPDTAKLLRGHILHNLGKYHQDRGEYHKAMTYLLQAKEHYERTCHDKGLAVVYGKLAFICKAQGLMAQSEEYYLLACKSFEEMGAVAEYVNTLHNYGFLKNAQGHYEDAESLFTKVQVFSREHDYEYGVGLGSNALSSVYLEQNRLEEAERIMLELEGTTFLLEHPDRRAGHQIKMGKLRIRQNREREALPYCTQALELGDRLGSLEIKKSACLCLSNAYEAMGSHASALQFLQQSYTYRDSLEQSQTKALLASVRAEYEFEKVEKELAQASLEVEREQFLRVEAEQAAALQRRMRLFLLALLLLAMGFLAYYLFNNRRVRRQNRVIQSALAEKEVLLGEVHHRVKNNLQLISSIIELQSRSTEHAPTEQLLAELRNRIHAITTLHQQLYQQPELHAIRTQDYLPPILDNLRQQQSPLQEVQLQESLQDITLPVGIAIPLGLIVSELVTNSYRHAFPPGGASMRVIRVTLEQVGDKVRLAVADNGIGSDPQKENFGLRMVRSLARQMKAQLAIDTANGTTTELSWQQQK